MPGELLAEEYRSRRFRNARQSGQLVVADGFQVQATAVGVPVVLRQGRNQLRPAFAPLGTPLGFHGGGRFGRFVVARFRAGFGR